MSNVALLIAGGSGNRMNQDIPKQFITVNERPVIVYTLEAFENHPEIDCIAVVCIEGWDQVLRDLEWWGLCLEQYPELKKNPQALLPMTPSVLW